MGYPLPLKQFSSHVAAHPDAPYLFQPEGGQWHTLSWQQVDESARRIAQGLLSTGFQPGDRIAILAKNSAEWVVADIAILMAGMISVPVYDTANAETISHILQHSGSTAVFIGKLADYSAANQATANHLTIGFPYAEIKAQEKWTDWLQKYAPLQNINAPNANDIATLVYTSGSEGQPKGVVLTHQNLAAQASAFVQSLPPEIKNREQRVLSYLPMAHITERSFVTMASLYFPKSSFLSIYFVESLATFVANIQYCQPTIFLSVPRLWVKFQAKILGKISRHRLNFLLNLPIIGKRVAAKIRRQLGLSETILFGCGSAPVAIETLLWYTKIGVNISEGWGMTETAGAACINMPFQTELLGTIGKPAKGIEMKISDGDEILIRGDAIFNQYYMNPTLTDANFEDGWFKTGDCGELSAEGAWRITGRIKEQFKTSKGKYVSPVPIERLLAANSDIEQVCVLGIGRKQPVALIVLNSEKTYKREILQNELTTTLAKVNSALEHHEQLDHLIVTKDSWTPENNLLTPTLKLKRTTIAEKYHHLINLSPQEKIIWED